MTCVIVDDEKQSRNTLKEEITALQNSYTIIGEADSVVTAIHAINTLQPDVVLLDIELGDGTGFDVIEGVKNASSKIIFVTAYNQYAIKAFRINAVDYLLKPINSKHLQDALQKAIPITSPNIQALKFRNTNQQRISFATADGYSLHLIDDIIHCESENNYTHVFLRNSEPLFISKTLKELEELLIDFGFERVHQSHLINLKYLKKYMNKDGGYVVLQDDTRIPVSQRKKTQLIEKLNNFLTIG
jgi:two-component system LytT family response regulator